MGATGDVEFEVGFGELVDFPERSILPIGESGEGDELEEFFFANSNKFSSAILSASDLAFRSVLSAIAM